MTNPRDVELLSAYIDRQLPAAEQARLETRLAREPELKQTLIELRRVQRAVRSLPQVKPPRSFTLKPNQVGARSPWPQLFPVFRLATTFAALALVILMTRDLMVTSSPTSQAEQAAPQAALVQETIGSLTETPAPEIAMLSSAPAITESVAAADAANKTTEPAAGGAVAMEPFSATVGATGPQPPAPVSSDTARSAANPTLTPSATEVSSPTPEEAVLDQAQAPTANPTPASPESGLRGWVIGLALLTVLLTLATWLTRQR